MKSVTVHVSPTGRPHLPVDVRRALGLKGPGHVVITIDDGEVRLRTMAHALARTHALARPTPQGPPGLGGADRGAPRGGARRAENGG